MDELSQIWPKFPKSGPNFSDFCFCAYSVQLTSTFPVVSFPGPAGDLERRYGRLNFSFLCKNRVFSLFKRVFRKTHFFPKKSQKNDQNPKKHQKSEKSRKIEKIIKNPKNRKKSKKSKIFEKSENSRKFQKFIQIC